MRVAFQNVGFGSSPLSPDWSPNVDGKWCCQKTLDLAFWCGKLKPECMGVNGDY
jgi:hypothetical protein